VQLASGEKRAGGKASITCMGREREIPFSLALPHPAAVRLLCSSALSRAGPVCIIHLNFWLEALSLAFLCLLRRRRQASPRPARTTSPFYEVRGWAASWRAFEK